MDENEEFWFSHEQALEVVGVQLTRAILGRWAQGSGVRDPFSLSEIASPVWQQVLARVLFITFSTAPRRRWRPQLPQRCTVPRLLLSPELWMDFGMSANHCSSWSKTCLQQMQKRGTAWLRRGAWVFNSTKWFYFSQIFPEIQICRRLWTCNLQILTLLELNDVVYKPHCCDCFYCSYFHSLRYSVSSLNWLLRFFTFL